MKNLYFRLMLSALASLMVSLPLCAQIVQGSCGPNITYSLNRGNGWITLTGTGDMIDNDYAEEIPWHAYRSEIKTVSINDGITDVAIGAFQDCPNLTSCSLPETMVSINAYAFQNCPQLDDIDLPASIRYIGQGAFSGCSALSQITAQMNPPCSFGVGAFDGIAATAQLFIPFDARAAYIQTGWTTEVFGGGLIEEAQVVGDFYYWLNTATHEAILSKAPDQEEVVVPERIEYRGQTYIVTAIAGTAFMFKQNIRSVTLPRTVRHIPPAAFYYCYGLASVHLPENLETIGNKSFAGKINLTSLTIPKTVTSIGDEAFAGCTGLHELKFLGGPETIGAGAFLNCTSLTEMTIPEGVARIDSAAFRGCLTISRVELPTSIDSIGAQAFYGCSSLMIVICGMEQPCSYGTDAFSNIYSTSYLYVPKGTTALYNRAGWKTKMKGGDFTHMTEERIRIDGIYYELSGLSGGEYVAFVESGMSEYKDSIVIPETVTYRDRTYTVTTIDELAFADSPLTYVSIPATVTEIFAAAFHGCNTLATVVSLSTSPYSMSANPTMFTGIADNCTLYVPAATRQAYIAAGWKETQQGGNFEKIIEMGDANGDGGISITDVGLMIDCILGTTPAGFYPIAADVNRDGGVSITDVGLVVDSILAQ